MRQKERTANHYQANSNHETGTKNIYYFKNRQNDASDLKSRKDASAESSGAITSFVQIPNRGNACISVTFLKR